MCSQSYDLIIPRGILEAAPNAFLQKIAWSASQSEGCYLQGQMDPGR